MFLLIFYAHVYINLCRDNYPSFFFFLFDKDFNIKTSPNNGTYRNVHHIISDCI